MEMEQHLQTLMSIKIGESQIPIELFQNIFHFVEDPKDVARFIISTKPTYQYYNQKIDTLHEHNEKEKTRKIIQDHLESFLVPRAIPQKCAFCKFNLMGSEPYIGMPSTKTPYQITKENNQYYISFETAFCSSCRENRQGIYEQLNLTKEIPIRQYMGKCFCWNLKPNNYKKNCSKCECKLGKCYYLYDNKYSLCKYCDTCAKQQCYCLSYASKKFEYPQ